MIPQDNILNNVGRLINDLIRKEFRAQGHTLTGQFENNLEYRIQIRQKFSLITGFGLEYGKILNDGLSKDEIDPNNQKELIDYFLKRGLPEREAIKAAFFTIRKWQQEGMSTDASKRFSSTGQRQHFIEQAFENPELYSTIDQLFDYAIEEKYRTVKSETI